MILFTRERATTDVLPTAEAYMVKVAMSGAT